MDQRVKEFFLQYERANSSSDVSGISALYADTFMFGGPNGVQSINKGDFLKVVPERKAYFSSMGLSETQLESVDASPIDSKYPVSYTHLDVYKRQRPGLPPKMARKLEIQTNARFQTERIEPLQFGTTRLHSYFLSAPFKPIIHAFD